MTYLLMIGYGREGRFDGYTQVAVDEVSFQLAKSIADEYDDDDFAKLGKKPRPHVVYMMALLFKSGHDDIVDIEEDPNHPMVKDAMSKWTILPVNPPYQGVRVMNIWNTKT